MSKNSKPKVANTKGAAPKHAGPSTRTSAGEATLALRSRDAFPLRLPPKSALFRRYGPGPRPARAAHGRRIDRARLQPFRLRTFRHQPRRHDRAHDRRACTRRAEPAPGSLLRQQFQECRPAAPAHACRAARPTPSRKKCDPASSFCAAAFRRCSKASLSSGRRPASWSGSPCAKKN